MMKKWRMGSLTILSIVALLLFGCESISPTSVEFSFTLAPGVLGPQDPAYSFAQATMDAGQRQLFDLDRQATEVSMDMAQAANDAALATREYNQRQQLELDYQATIISQNMANAEITQEFISQQTKIAGDATIIAQNNAATATQAANFVIASQTAQAQARLDTQDQQTRQAVAELTAYPLTATPFAVTQAALLMQQYDRERQTFEDNVVAPLIPVISVLIMLLLILGIVLAYRRFMPVYTPQRLRILASHRVLSPPLMIDGVIVEPDSSDQPNNVSGLPVASLPRLSAAQMIQVEIVEATEPPFSHWIAGVEYQLAAEGRQSL